MTSDREDWTHESLDEVIPDGVVESWDEDQLAPGWVAWIKPDNYAESPRSWGDEARFVSNSKYVYNECNVLARLIREADEYGHDDDWIVAKLDDEEGVLAFERFDFGDHGDGTMWAYVPKVPAAKLLGNPGYGWDATEWLRQAQDLKAVAQDHLNAAIANFKQWSEGDVYELTVCNLATGEEDYLCGIYDDFPYTHCLEEARNIMSQNRKEQAA